MIVRCVDQGWTVAFHPSHGLLAQRIASFLLCARELPFWFESQVAIGLHDDIHRVFEAGKRALLTTVGAPRDFTLVPMSDVNRVDEMQDRIDEAYRKHSWLGVMQSTHCECLYEGEDTSSEMKGLLATEKQRRRETLVRLEVAEEMVQLSYDWMHFCDRLSLILCGNDVPAMNRRLEIITNGDGTRFEIWQDEQDRICVSPWPFANPKVELVVEYRTLEQLSFADDAELAKVLKACRTECRTIELFEQSE